MNAAVLQCVEGHIISIYKDMYRDNTFDKTVSSRSSGNNGGDGMLLSMLIFH